MDIYVRYGPALLRKAQRVLGNREDARDAVQGLFVDMLQRGEQTADLPFLYRAITNRCLNQLRDRKNRDRLLARQDVALRPTARTRCDDEVIGLDLLVKLADRLDRKSLEVLVYRFVDDMTQEEIATLMSTSRKTIGVRLARVRDEVKALVSR